MSHLVAVMRLSWPGLVLWVQIAVVEGLKRVSSNGLFSEVTLEKQAEIAQEFDAVHSVGRAQEVGSLEEIVAPASMRKYLIDLLAQELS
jgi:hypothetical protein